MQACKTWRLTPFLGWWKPDGTPNTDLIPFKSLQQGSASYIVAAFDPTISGKPPSHVSILSSLTATAEASGSYISASQLDDTVAAYAVDPKNAEKLWTLSEQLVGQEFTYD